MQTMSKLLTRLENEADKKYVLYVLAVVSFLESVIFPIPVDVFTFSLASVKPKKWVKFGLIATVSSVAGAFFAYFLGSYFFNLFGKQFIEFYGYQKHFNHVVKLFDNNTFIVMFTSAFTIIPFKIFTLIGGALKVSFIPFILASVIGRGLRFFLEVYLAQRFGKRVTDHIIKRFNLYSVIFVLLFIIYFLFKKYFM